jgi:hypothetical protein
MGENPRALLVVTVCGTYSYHRKLNGKFVFNKAVVVCVEAVLVKSAVLVVSHTSKKTRISKSVLMILLYVWMFITVHTMTENQTNNIAL